jgi:biopolymer transport protein ExbD
MARTAAVHHGEPMGNINVTPFIDVLLVLLIMIILTVPPGTHKLPLDLPNGPSPTFQPEPPHRLTIDAKGALGWDGRAVGDAELKGLLVALAEKPGASLEIQSDPEARYERFESILATIKRSGVTRMGFVGNETMKL